MASCGFPGDKAPKRVVSHDIQSNSGHFLCGATGSLNEQMVLIQSRLFSIELEPYLKPALIVEDFACFDKQTS